MFKLKDAEQDTQRTHIFVYRVSEKCGAGIELPGAMSREALNNDILIWIPKPSTTHCWNPLYGGGMSQKLTKLYSARYFWKHTMRLVSEDKMVN